MAGVTADERGGCPGVAPGEFAGDVGVFTALSNGVHDVAFTAWQDEQTSDVVVVRGPQPANATATAIALPGSHGYAAFAMPPSLQRPLEPGQSPLRAFDLRSDGNPDLLVLDLAVNGGGALLALAEAQKQQLAQQHLVELGALAASMAHELRNPLASLKGHAQLLAEQLSEDPKGQAKAELVVHEAERLESLTRNLLEFVRDGAIDTRLVPMRQLAEEALAVAQMVRDVVSPGYLARATATLRSTAETVRTDMAATT